MGFVAPVPSSVDSYGESKASLPLSYSQQPPRSQIIREERQDSLTFLIPKLRLTIAAALVIIPYAGGWAAMALCYVVLAHFGPVRWQGLKDQSLDLWGACAFMLAIILIPLWLFRRRREVRVTRDQIQFSSSSIFDDSSRAWQTDEIARIKAIASAVVLISRSGKKLGRIGVHRGSEATWMARVLQEWLGIDGADAGKKPSE